jgi:hypothetical protein
MLRIHDSSAPANSCQQTAQQIPDAAHQQSPANPCDQRSQRISAKPSEESLRPAQPSESLSATHQRIPGSCSALLSPARCATRNLCQQRSRARSAPAAQPSGLCVSEYLPDAQPSDSPPTRTRSFLRGSQEFTKLRASEELGAWMLTGKRIKVERARAGRRQPSVLSQTTLYVTCGAGAPSQRA